MHWRQFLPRVGQVGLRGLRLAALAYAVVLLVMHPVQRPIYEFHRAEIFIDDALNIPLRYAAYHWPEKPGSKELPVLEEYTYLNVKLNVGLTDADFDSENPNYNF